MSTYDFNINIKVENVTEEEADFIVSGVTKLYPQLLGIYAMFEGFISLSGPMKLLRSDDNHFAMRKVISERVWQIKRAYCPVIITVREVMGYPGSCIILPEAVYKDSLAIPFPTRQAYPNR